MAALNLIKHRKNRHQVNKRTKQIWVLALAPCISQFTQNKSYYYNGAKDLSQVHLTSDIHHAPWFESKHHANSHLTYEMKHAGLIAMQQQVAY